MKRNLRLARQSGMKVDIVLKSALAALALCAVGTSQAAPEDFTWGRTLWQESHVTRTYSENTAPAAGSGRNNSYYNFSPDGQKLFIHLEADAITDARTGSEDLSDNVMLDWALRVPIAGPKNESVSLNLLGKAKLDEAGSVGNQTASHSSIWAGITNAQFGVVGAKDLDNRNWNGTPSAKKSFADMSGKWTDNWSLPPSNVPPSKDLTFFSATTQVANGDSLYVPLRLVADTFSKAGSGVIGGDYMKAATTLDFTATLNPHPIPEPQTYGLMLAGLTMVGWYTKRRRPKS